MSITPPPGTEAYRNWVCYRQEPQPNSRKIKKPPVCVTTGNGFEYDKPENHVTFEQASAYWITSRVGIDGVGFVLRDDDPFIVIDLDNILDDDHDFKDGKLQAEIMAFNSYFELSPSKRGIHLWVQVSDIGRWKNLQGKRRTDKTTSQWEVFVNKGYVTVTGNRHPLSPENIAISDEAIASFAIDCELHEVEEAVNRELQTFPQSHDDSYIFKSTGVVSGFNDLPKPVSPPMDDEEVVQRASKAQNGKKFRDLFEEGDMREYGDDQSAAEFGLARIFSFYTQDPEQIVRLLHQSALSRSKMDQVVTRANGLTHAQTCASKAITSQHKKGEFYRGGTASCSIIGMDINDSAAGDERGGRTSPIRFPRTDLGNAERFVVRNGENVMFVNEWDSWLVWNSQDGMWKKDNHAAIRLAAATVRSMYNELARIEGIEDEVERKAHIRHILASESNRALRDMLNIAKSFRGIAAKPSDFDNNPLLLKCMNGTLDFSILAGLDDPAEFRPREDRREDMITRRIPITYDPAAKAEKWNAHLALFLRDSEKVALLQEWTGYSLTGDTSERKMLVLCGPKGGNGKTVTVETIAGMMGEYATVTNTKTIMAKRSDGINNDVAALKGARLVHASEGKEDHRLDEALVKEITGGDTLHARFLHKEFFSFRPEFKLWFRTNHMPEIRELDDAIYSRLQILMFDYQIAEAENADIAKWRQS